MKQVNKNTSLRARVLGFFRRRQRQAAAQRELWAWWQASGQFVVAFGFPLSAAELSRVLRLFWQCSREVRRAWVCVRGFRRLLLRSAAVAELRRSRVRRVRARLRRRWFRRLLRRSRRCTGKEAGRALPSQTLHTMLAQLRYS